jgi:hypothetical protein
MNPSNVQFSTVRLTCVTASFLHSVVCVLFCSCFLTLAVYAQTYSPYQFLRVNQSARSSALGGAVVSMTEDPSTVFFNPASISTVQDGRVSFTFQKHALDINSGLASYTGRLGTSGSFAATMSYASFGEFVGRDALGNTNGSSFSPRNVSVGFNYSNMVDTNFYYGAGLNFVNATFADGGTSAVTLNAGAIYRIPKARTNIGLSVLHLGTQLSKINISEPLPLDVRLGVNHRLRGLPLLVNVSFNRLAEDQQSVLERFKNFSLGGELYIGKVLEIRLGYDNTLRNATNFETQARMAGLSAGVGIKVKDIMIDYGFVSLSSALMLHRFSVNLGI